MTLKKNYKLDLSKQIKIQQKIYLRIWLAPENSLHKIYSKFILLNMVALFWCLARYWGVLCCSYAYEKILEARFVGLCILAFCHPFCIIRTHAIFVDGFCVTLDRHSNQLWFKFSAISEKVAGNFLLVIDEKFNTAMSAGRQNLCFEVLWAAFSVFSHCQSSTRNAGGLCPFHVLICLVVTLSARWMSFGLYFCG